MLGRPSLYLNGSEDQRLERLRRKTLVGVVLVVVSTGALFLDSVVYRSGRGSGPFLILAMGILVAWIIVLLVAIRRRKVTEVAIASFGILVASAVLAWLAL